MRLLYVCANFFLVTMPFFVFGAPGGFVQPGDTTNIESGAIVQQITQFIASLFLFGSVIAMIYSGYLYFSAAGDTKKIEVAHQNFKWGLVGIAIGLLAYAFPGMIKLFIEQGV